MCVYPLFRAWRIKVPPLRRVTFGKRPKSNQKGLPQRSAHSLVLGVPSLRVPSGCIAYGLLRCTSSRCVWLRQTALRAHPRMNPSTQPADGACASRSSAAAELTLILLSGEKQKHDSSNPCRSLACQRRRPDSRPISSVVPPRPVAADGCNFLI